MTAQAREYLITGCYVAQGACVLAILYEIWVHYPTVFWILFRIIFAILAGSHS
jgi:hypothetical protein